MIFYKRSGIIFKAIFPRVFNRETMSYQSFYRPENSAEKIYRMKRHIIMASLFRVMGRMGWEKAENQKMAIKTSTEFQANIILFL